MLTLVAPVVQNAPPLDPARASSSWRAARAVLTWDVSRGRTAREGTVAQIVTDGTFVYVRFDADQREAIVADQHSNDTVVGGSDISGGIAWTDDAVWVDIWPTGPSGFQYQFEANPNGVHNEASSENVAFAPHWISNGRVTPEGYTVTMAIPIAVIHGAHSGRWRMQFVRYVRATGALIVWSYDSGQTNPDDPAHAGSAIIRIAKRLSVPSSRVGVYGLGDLASAPAGGSTSRVGADFSVPIFQTGAVFGTLHPDYSNVEVDQQSISPTVYQHVYSEVRPFFTQAAQYYNIVGCYVCGGYRTSLYTPAIPTPAQGYAFEGRQGNFGLAAFDAIGDARNDSAMALDYTSSDNEWNASFQRVTASLPGLIDQTSQASIAWTDGKYLSAYASTAAETGTLVTDAAQGRWLDAGAGYSDQQFALYAALREVGDEFDPVDGFDSHPGIAGYGVSAARVWIMAEQDALSSIGVQAFLHRYQGVSQGLTQSDNALLLDVLTKKTLDIQLYTGSSYWRFGSVLTPISQNGGFSITYHSGMQTNMSSFPAHGSAATPTSIEYDTGHYGAGRLDTWYRSSTLRVGMRGALTFTADSTQQFLPRVPANVQWFHGLAYAYQITADSSLALGVRSIVGSAPEPNGGGDCRGRCSNLSFAYYLRWPHEELYVAYGDPNALTTVPQTVFKLIFYVGAQKGT